MKIVHILIMFWVFASLGIASSQNITPDEIIAENTTVINESVIEAQPLSTNITLGAITENHTAINESDPVYWYNKGEELLNASKYNESIEAYDRSIELNQSYAEAWNHKGKALLNLGKYNDSILDL